MDSEFHRQNVSYALVFGTLLGCVRHGGLIPWDDVPIKDLETKPGEFDRIIKHLKAQKLTFSLGTREGYLLVAISPTACRAAASRTIASRARRAMAPP